MQSNMADSEDRLREAHRKREYIPFPEFRGTIIEREFGQIKIEYILMMLGLSSNGQLRWSSHRAFTHWVHRLDIAPYCLRAFPTNTYDAEL
jgi:hypothetical protein